MADPTEVAHRSPQRLKPEGQIRRHHRIAQALEFHRRYTSLGTQSGRLKERLAVRHKYHAASGS